MKKQLLLMALALAALSAHADGTTVSPSEGDVKVFSVNTGSEKQNIVLTAESKLTFQDGKLVAATKTSDTPLACVALTAQTAMTFADGYQRNVTKGNYGTICLSKATDATNLTNAYFYSITGQNDNGIIMEQAKSLAAGTPYIFYARESSLVLDYDKDSETATEAQSATGLVGNISGSTVTVPAGDYILSSNKVRKVGSGAKVQIADKRAYIDLTNVGTAVATAKAVTIGFANEATGVSEVRGDVNVNTDADFFNLGGQRVAGSVHGVIIINGRKVVK